MYVQLYNFLFEQIVSHFQPDKIEAGDRFHVYFEKHEQVDSFYQSIYSKADCMFEYNGLTLPEITFNDVGLLVATESSCDPAFLTKLRNEVASEKDHRLIKKSLLILHYTPLDSIMEGAGTLTREGAPLHQMAIETTLRKKIFDSSFSNNEKELMNTWLSRNKAHHFGGTTAFLEYDPLLNALKQASLNHSSFRDLGYFPDHELNSITGKNELQSRLKDNHEWFDRISTLHQYNEDISDDLDKDFTETGKSRLKADNWDTCTYGEIKKWHEDKKNKVPPAYVKKEELFPDQSLLHWEKVEAETGAKSRKHHIVIFNPDINPEIKFSLMFDREIIGNSIQVLQKNGHVLGTKSGRMINVVISDCSNEPIFGRINYEDKESNQKQTFTFAVLPVNVSHFRRCATIFQTIDFNVKSGTGCLVLHTTDNVIFNDDAIIEDKSILKHDNVVPLLDGIKYIFAIDETDDTEFVDFSILIDSIKIPFRLRNEVSRPKNITGLRLWKMKREKKKRMEYCGENRIAIGTEEYYVVKQIAEFLEIERQIVKEFQNHCHWVRTKDGLLPKDINIDKGVREAYQKVIAELHGGVPSLTNIGGDLLDAMRCYVNTFLDFMENARDGEMLDTKTENLLKFCTIQHEDGEKRVYFTPLHPLNIAYQLKLLDEAGMEDLPEEMLRSMSPQGLLPFINSPFGSSEDKFIPVDELELPEWIAYRSHTTVHQDRRHEYTERLIGEKITEYVRHFHYLFSGAKGAPVRLNLVNLGDCIDALQGIITYFKNALNEDGDAEKVLPVQVNIYGNSGPYNQFEQFSHYSDPDEIENVFEVTLKLRTKNLEKSDVLNVIRERLRFFDKSKQPDLDYAHITFYKFDNCKTKWAYHGTDKVETGCSLQGLVSAVPSVYLQEEYKTGFGCDGLPLDKSSLIKMAKRMNAIARVANTSNPFSSDEAIFSVIPSEQREDLDRIYSKSNWVTFIEPKVDLNFFKLHQSTKDLIIIHYSDQYNNASGYDAITVTRKSKQYQAIIHEFLTNQGLKSSDETEMALINMFNAINGDWLLRLISADTRGGAHFPKEKISILSAVKSVMAVLEHPKIKWIPLSLEEVLRVSNGVGLKQTDGLFSAKNLGQVGRYCDDLLMAGLELINGGLCIHFLPVEVKLGQNNHTIIEKAKEQGKATANTLREFLTPVEDNFKAKFYRAFFARLILIGAEKMDLYDLAEDTTTIQLVKEQRCTLLNDDFVISWKLQECFAEYGVVSFRTDDFVRNLSLENDGFLLELLGSDGHTNLAKSIADLASLYQNPQTTINQDHLLLNKYKPEEPRVIPNLKTTIIDNSSTDETPIIDELNKEKQVVCSQPDGMKILFGHHANDNSTVFWFPNDTNKVMHTNTGIIGTMGTGKTQFTKSLVAQLVQESKYNVKGTKLGFLIFDYKGDYIKEDFLKATNAKAFALHNLPYNPLALTVGEKPLPMLPLHTANSIKESISTAFNLGNVQRQKLRDCIMKAYENFGIDKSNPGTWNNPAPTLSDVCSLYLNDKDIKQDSLYAAIDNLYQFEIFEPDTGNTVPLWNLLDGVIVINLSGYDQDIQNLVVAITLDQFYSQMQKAGHSTIKGNLRELTKMVLVDEADNFLSQNFQAIRKILKEGREFGVGTILSTQFLNHFSTSDNEYSNYIMTWIVHRVSEISQKEVTALFGQSTNEDLKKRMEAIFNLKKHYSVTKLEDGKALMIRDRAFWQLIEDLKKEWTVPMEAFDSKLGLGNNGT